MSKDYSRCDVIGVGNRIERSSLNDEKKMKSFK